MTPTYRIDQADDAGVTIKTGLGKFSIAIQSMCDLNLSKIEGGADFLGKTAEAPMRDGHIVCGAGEEYTFSLNARNKGEIVIVLRASGANSSTGQIMDDRDIIITILVA